MNITTPSLAQASSFPASQVFPQPIPSVIMAMPLDAAIAATLTFFDAGAISADTAESWIITLENL